MSAHIHREGTLEESQALASKAGRWERLRAGQPKELPKGLCIMILCLILLRDEMSEVEMGRETESEKLFPLGCGLVVGNYS